MWLITLFKKQRLYTQLIIITSATLFLLFTGFSIIIYAEAARQKEQNTKLTEEIILQFSSGIIANYKSLANLTNIIAYNSDIQGFFLTTTEREKFEYHNKLQANLIDYTALNPGIIDIILVDNEGNRYNMSDNTFQLPSLTLDDVTPKLSTVQSQKRKNMIITYTVMGRAIFSIDRYIQTLEKIGEVYFILGPESLTGLEFPFKTDTSTIITLSDSNNIVLWTNNKSTNFVNNYNDIQEKKLTPLPYTLTIQQYSQVFFSNFSKQTVYQILILLLLVLLSALLWITWARNIVHPLKQMVLFIESIKPDSIDTPLRLKAPASKEINILATEINNMLKKIESLTTEIIQAKTGIIQIQLEKQQAELDALKSQINPHFLYNTLETMVGIAAEAGQTQIMDIAKSLGIIFKYTIKGDSIVPINEEIKIVTNYLRIQHYRFSDRFTSSVEVSPSCSEYLIPKMILQPIVENAVIHGIEHAQHLCTIVIKATLQNDDILITIDDDGVGIPESRLIQIQNELKNQKQSENKAHIGMQNVHSRIQLMYGKKYGLSITSIENKKTHISILLPQSKT